jgi:hypothetical protein
MRCTAAAGSSPAGDHNHVIFTSWHCFLVVFYEMDVNAFQETALNRMNLTTPYVMSA